MNAIPWTELWSAALPIIAALTAYELICVLPLRRRLAALGRDQHRQQRALRSTARLAPKLAKSDKALREQLVRLGERLGQLELRSDTRSYEQAISLAAKGTGTESLVSCLGLSEGEANLVRLLHGKRSPSPAPAGVRRRPK